MRDVIEHFILKCHLFCDILMQYIIIVLFGENFQDDIFFFQIISFRHARIEDIIHYRVEELITDNLYGVYYCGKMVMRNILLLCGGTR